MLRQENCKVKGYKEFKTSLGVWALCRVPVPKSI